MNSAHRTHLPSSSKAMPTRLPLKSEIKLFPCIFFFRRYLIAIHFPAFVLFNWLTFSVCTFCALTATIYTNAQKLANNISCTYAAFNNNIQHVIYVNSICSIGINVPVSVHIFIWHNSWCLHIFDQDVQSMICMKRDSWITRKCIVLPT